MLETNDEIRQLASKRTPTHLVKQAAIHAGMRTLRQDGWRRVCQGTTTVQEVLRVTKVD
jgi:type II secretory ATPase GspE/PulE/Tfp pilus assembly ATPase PilB-like protein